MHYLRFFWNKSEMKYEAWITNNYGIGTTKISEITYTKLYSDLQSAQHAWNYWLGTVRGVAQSYGYGEMKI